MANAQRPGPVGMMPVTGRPGTVGPSSKAVFAGAVGSEALTDEQQQLLLDVGQMVLDIAGIFEPTPFADTANAVISAARSDWAGAAISVAGTVPYIGDAAKAGRFPKYLKSVEKAIAEARQSRPLADLLRPGLTKLYCVLDLLPAADLPAAMAATVKELRKRIVGFLGPAGRATRARSLLRVLRGQVDDAGKVLDTIEARLKHATASGAEPAADDFLAELKEHVRNFEGKPTLRVTTKPERAARASDTIGNPKSADGEVVGKASDMGKYLVPTDDLTKAADRNASAVEGRFNDMTALELQEIPAGSILLDGTASPRGKLTGGGRQVAHVGQLGPDGKLSRPRERDIVDGRTQAGGRIVDHGRGH